MTRVERFGIWNPTSKTVSGDYLRVDGRSLGEFRDLVDAEFRRAGSAFHMRPMWYTGSPFADEILELERTVLVKL